jgi:hypothetical protein
MEWPVIFRKKNDPEQEARLETIALLDTINDLKGEIEALRNKPEGLNTHGINEASSAKKMDRDLLENKISDLVHKEKEVYKIAMGAGIDPIRLIDREFAEYLTKNQTEDDEVLFEVRRNILMKSDPVLEERPMNSLFVPQEPPGSQKK